MKKDKKGTRKNLRYSFLDGVFSSSMIGFTQDYFIPYMLYIGGTLREIAFLSAIPNLVASLVQVITHQIMIILRSRKKTITVFVFLQALVLGIIAVLSFLKIKSPVLLIILVVLFATFGAVSVPAWGSLMSDIVPERRRGNYFGWRNSILGLIIVLTSLSAGIMLYYMKSESLAIGFACLFSAAFIARIASWLFLGRMIDPEEQKVYNASRISINDFIKKLKNSNFTRFVISVSLLNFSVNMAAPFFAVLLLKELRYNYLVYSIIMMTAPLVMYLMMRRWGKLADKIGNVRIIKITGPFIAIIPVFWIISLDPVFLIFAQVFSGFVWAGYNLSASNFIFDAVQKEKRVRYISYFNVINGVMLSAGSISGAYLIQYLPPVQGYKILTLFMVSAALRLLASLTVPLKLKEVRRVSRMSSNQVFSSLIGIRPLLGIQRKTIRYLR